MKRPALLWCPFVLFFLHVAAFHHGLAVAGGAASPTAPLTAEPEQREVCPYRGSLLQRSTKEMRQVLARLSLCSCHLLPGWVTQGWGRSASPEAQQTITWASSLLVPSHQGHAAPPARQGHT